MAPWSYKLKRHKRGAVRLNFKLKLNIKEIMVKNKKKSYAIRVVLKPYIIGNLRHTKRPGLQKVEYFRKLQGHQVMI